jgi:hypothetical protein
MSRTRSQRRRTRILLEKLFAIAFIIALVVLIWMLYQQVSEIEQMQQERRAREDSVVIVNAREYLPFDFDWVGYKDACYRYDVEEGNFVPAQKETAPELAGSGAEDARD